MAKVFLGEQTLAKLIGMISSEFKKYVKKTDYAHRSKAGLVKTDGNEAYKGVDIIDGVPCLMGTVSPLSDAFFNNPEAYKVPLLSKDIYRWMKVGLTTNKIALTDEEKTAAQEWLGVTAPRMVPEASSTDDGKFLRVVDGAPAWVELTDVSEVGA